MATLPQDVAGNEPFDGDIEAESSDYTSYELLPPGEYTSPNREVEVSQRVTKRGKNPGQPFIMADMKLTTLLNEDGQEIVLNRPMRTFINTLQRRGKNQQGSTSDVAAYLRCVGLDPQQLRGEELKQALAESAAYPVKVVVGWTNMAKKNPDGTFGEEWAKTSDFNVGTPDEPKFLPTIERDGETVRAKHRVAFFRKV